MNSSVEVRIVGEGDNIIRHVKGTDIDDGEVQSTAFELGDDDGMSFSWVEYFEGEFENQILQAISEMCAERTVRSTHRFAQLPIESIQQIFSREGFEVPEIVHKPLPALKAHCEIDRRYLLNRVCESLLTRAVCALYAKP